MFRKFFNGGSKAPAAHDKRSYSNEDKENGNSPDYQIKLTTSSSKMSEAHQPTLYKPAYTTSYATSGSEVLRNQPFSNPEQGLEQQGTFGPNKETGFKLVCI